MKNVENLIQKAAFGFIFSTLCILSIQSQEIIHEGFDNGTTVPEGWIVKAGGTYTTTSNSGNAAPSIKLSETGNFIETKDFIGGNECTLWLKGVSIDSISSLVIFSKTKGIWEKLDSITKLTNSKKILTYSLPDSTTKLRFTYFKSKGNLAFDDLVVKKTVQVNDTIPPAFLEKSPLLIDKNDSSAAFKIKLDKPGTIFYFLSKETTPTFLLADLINPSTIILTKGKIKIENNLDTNINFTGLRKDINYFIYWVTSLSDKISSNSKLVIARLSLKIEDRNLFFSEIIKGTGYNKAIEIFNPTSDTLLLNNFRIAIASDGTGWKTTYYTFPVNSKIAPLDVFLIVKANADSIDLKKADVLTNATVVNFTGNDARGLEMLTEKDSIWKLIDVFGDPLSAKNINVSGIEGAASNHTIIRKPYIKHGNIDWITSSGTNEINSEWIVSRLNDFSNLGKHNFNPIVKLTFDSILFDCQEMPSIYDTIKHSITFTLHSSAEASNLKLKYHIADGLEISPDPNTINDFSKPVIFKLTDINKTDSLEWTINVKVDDAPRIVGVIYEKNNSDTITLIFNKQIRFIDFSQTLAIKKYLIFRELGSNFQIPIGVFISDDKTKLKVVPDQKLKSSINYVLKVDSIEDNFDNLMQPYEYSVTTEDNTENLISHNDIQTLKAWPNPAQDLIFLQVPSEFELNNMKVELVTTQGKIFYPMIIEKSTLTELNISNFKDGNYFLRLSNHMNCLTVQVIIKNK